MMNIYTRCSKCHAFNSQKNKRCTRCDTSLSQPSAYYIFISEKGKRKFEKAGNSITEAKNYYMRRKSGSVDSTKAQPIFFDEYVQKIFVPHYETKNKGINKEIYLINAVMAYFKDKLLNAITPTDVDIFYQSKINFYAPATAKRYLALVKRMFNYAIEMGYIEHNPVKTKISKFDNKRTRYLDKNEQERLLSACKGSASGYLYPMVFIALYSGLRKGEIEKMTREDIYVDRIIVRAENAKSSKRREVPIPNILKEYLNTLQAIHFDYDIKTAFNTACKKAEITDFHFHDLRHTYASNLILKGVDLYVVKELLGHSSIEVTQRYAHLRPSLMDDAVKKLDMD